jgi:hypothetical protein
MLNFLEAIQRDAQSLVQLYTRDPDRPVPSCPGWVVRNLHNHVDETCRETLGRFGLGKFGVEVSETGLAAALDALQTAGIEATDPRLQDLAEECALHLWDAQNAFGEAQPVEAELACLGVDEYFEIAAPGVLKYRGIRAGDGQTLHLHRTDGEGEWFVVLEELPVVSHKHAKADVAIRGTASDLFLCLWGRVEPPGVIGDIEVFRHFRAVTKH